MLSNFSTCFGEQELMPSGIRALDRGTWGMATIRYKLGHLLEIARLSLFSGLNIGTFQSF